MNITFHLTQVLAELAAVSTGIPQIIYYQEKDLRRHYSYCSQDIWEASDELRETHSLYQVVHKCNVMRKEKGVW